MRAGSDTAARLRERVKKHADLLLKHASDPKGESPLFVNALDGRSLQPVPYDPDHVNRKALLSSPASQSHWFKLLDGLSEVTGLPRYAERTKEVYRYLLGGQTDKQGLLYWGGHTANNLETGTLEFAGDKSKVHELKMHYPDYGLMWKADPAGTRRYIEAIWNAHILDWGTLDFNRHGPYGTERGRIWENEYQGGDVFFWGKGLTFVNAGSDLYYAAAMLSKLSGEQAPLHWAKRLASRYVETRQEGVGISGYQFSQSAGSWCDGPAVRGDRAQYQIAPLVPEGHLVYEGTLFKPRPAVQRCQLAIGEMLGEEGEGFIRWACEEMTAWGRTAFREKDCSYVPMLTDGFSLEGLVLDRKGYFGPAGTVFRAMPLSGDDFWLYAYGYRLSKDPFLWEMARSIAKGIGLGELGSPQGEGRSLRGPGSASDYRVLYALLDLYRATEDRRFLETAAGLGEGMAEACLGPSGAIQAGETILTDHPLPLALLHLADAWEGRASALRPAWK